MKNAHLLFALFMLACSKPNAEKVTQAPSNVGTESAISAPAITPCSGESAMLEVWDKGTPVFELICEHGERRARVTEFGTAVEAAIGVQEWDRAWQTIDATGWQTLATSCGKAADEGYSMTITRNGTTRSFGCGPKLPARHAALRDALYAVEKLATRPTDTQANGWTIGRGSVGPIRLGMGAAELRALPNIALNDATMVDEGEEIPMLEVSMDGRHELTLTLVEDKVTVIEIVGGRARIEAQSVGATPAELEAAFGKPAGFEPGVDATPACAVFAKAPGVQFCFETDASSWPQIVAKRQTVNSMLLRN